MKVRQALQILMKCDPNLELVVSSHYPYLGYYEVERIEEFDMIKNEQIGCNLGPHRKDFSTELGNERNEKSVRALCFLGK